MIVTQISIDLSGINRFEYVIAKQGDVNSRLLQVQLLNNGKIYVLDDQTTARVSITKPDDEEVLQDCTINNNRVEILLDANILAAAGTAETEIVLTGSGGHVLTSATFDIVIVATNTGKGAESSSDYQSFKKALAKVDGFKNDIAVERARINQFTKLQDGSTTGDAELIDGRTDYEGESWDNIGEHIRNVTGQLTKKIEFTENNGYIGTEGEYKEAAGEYAEKHTSLIPVYCGMKIRFKLKHSEKKYMWAAYALYDEDGNFLIRNVLVNGTNKQKHSEVIEITEEKARHILFAYRTFEDYEIGISSVAVTEMAKKVNEIEKNVRDLLFNVHYCTNEKELSSLLNWKNGTLGAGEGSYSEYRIISNVVALTGVKQLIVTANAGYSWAITLYDSNNNFIYDSGWKAETGIITVNNAAYAVFALCSDTEWNTIITPEESANISIKGYSSDKIEFKENPGYISAFDTYVEATAQAEKYTDRIPVCCGMKISFKLTYSEKRNGWVAYALYDSNGKFISRTVIKNNADMKYFGDIIEVTEEKANYIAFTYRTFENDPIDYSVIITYESISYENFIKNINKIGSSATIMKEWDTTVKSVNHRGYCTVAPENTLQAYKLSKKKGFNMVETDIGFTKDNVCVLLHDSTINRTARNLDGSELGNTINIANITYEEALQYDFGVWQGEEYAGTKIPTFAEFIVLCKNLGLHPYIELKAGTKEQIKESVDIVKTHGMKDKVTWISYFISSLEYVKTYDETARLGYVVSAITADTITATQGLKTGKNEVFIDAYYHSLTKELITLCSDAEIPLEVWTVNSETDILALDSYVSGVTSDLYIAGKVLYEKYID